MRKPEPVLPWLTTTPRHSAKVRLFCFPHSGGGPSAYRSWSDGIPAWIDVIPIQLPGREQRSSEPPSTSLDELADALTGVVTQYTHRPFALFGHSLGALLAYEVARRLQRDGVAAPTALLVAGAAAPHRMVPAALHELPDDALLREIVRLGGISPKLRDDENLLHAALPALRADVTMFTTYTHRPGPSLECPVAVLTGADDPLTPAEETSAWSELTHADTTVHTFPGGHFFVVDQGTPVTRTITGELRRTLPSAAQVRTEDSIRPTPTTPSPPTRSALPRSAGEPVAVVGIGCRLPGAAGPEAYWRLLADGVDVVSDVPNARSGDHGVFAGLPPRLGGDAVPSQGGFIDDVEGFDPAFFGIPSREATRMDPQQRLLLEVAWEALEDALIPPTSLAGSRTGVFIGQMSRDYWDLQSRHTSVDAHSLLGSGLASFLSGRISFTLDLRGPSISLDTACSSSLVAVHLAGQSLRYGDSDLALAGGVNLVLVPELAKVYEQVGLMSRSGRCRFGDARADGFVRSDGVGLVVLKPLGQAQADGNRIYAVILGSVANNDGSGGGSLTAPAQDAQERLLIDALDAAGVQSSEVDYVEAHGTGTEVGDTIELQALSRVFGSGRPADRPCVVGSAKTNIGHTEGAAGISGFIKTVLSLYHREIPGNPLLSDPHPLLNKSPRSLEIPVATRPWPAGPRPIAGVTSFGLSGTNVHVVLGSVPTSAEAAGSGLPLILPISARHPSALNALIDAYADRLDGATATAAEQVCAAAAHGRSHHRWRAAVSATDGSRLAAALRALPTGTAGAPRAGRPRVTFVFAGHGGQWHGMGRELFRASPVFRDALDECDSAMRAELDWSVIELLTSGDPAALESSAATQPAMWAMHIALTAYWCSWGVRPDTVIGHSFGEVAAAQIAGALDLKAAARLICRRSQLTHRTDGQGGMVAVALPEAEVAEEIATYQDRLTIAAVNSARSTVISGDEDALTTLLADLDGRGVRAGRVRIPFAAHSAHMDPLRTPLIDALDGLRPGPARVTFRSTVTGRAMAGPDLDARYWGDNLRQPVRFAEAITAECDGRPTVFLEIGPHSVLTPAVRQCVAEHGSDLHTTVPGLTRNKPEVLGMAGAAAHLYTAGVDLDWAARYETVPAPEDLPRYPWQHRPTWFTPPAQHTNDVKQPPVPEPPAIRVDDEPAGTLTQEIAEVLGVRAKDIRRSESLRLLGLDSLAASEIRVRIDRRWRVDIPASTVLDSTVDQIAAELLVKTGQTGT